MEEQDMNQNLKTTQEPEHQNPSSSNHKSRKKLILAILGIILLLLLFSGASYYFGVNKNNNSLNTSKGVQQVNSSPTPIQTSSNAPQNLVPITKDTVSYGYQGSKLLMHYRGRVYSYDSVNKNMNESEPDTKYSNIAWHGLLQAPQSVNDAIKKHGGAFDHIFDMLPLPNNKFIFVMRWDRILGKDETGWDLPVYYFNSENQTVNEILSERWALTNSEFHVPRINSVSPDQNLLALNMYGCWNCGGHTPHVKLVNIETKATKDLGLIIDFKWTGNNTYSYKEFKEIECSEPQPGPCLEDSKNLPLKTGSFE